MEGAGSGGADKGRDSSEGSSYRQQQDKVLISVNEARHTEQLLGLHGLHAQLHSHRTPY